MSSEKLDLTCLVWPIEHPNLAIVSIEIGNDEPITSLKSMLRFEYARTLAAVDTPDFVLWRCSICIDDHLEENLKKTRFDDSNTELLRLSPPITKISKYFTTGLPEGTINILVELPEYHDGPPSKRVRTVEEFNNIWSLSKQPDTTQFIVQRKLELEDTHDAPSTFWFMKPQAEINKVLDFNFGRGRLSGILIREEYTEAFRAVIDFAGGEKACRRTEDTDGETGGFQQSETGVQASYINPFLNSRRPATFKVGNGGFVLIGHPGIGKTLWLIAMLILRLHAGLPTIFQSKTDEMYVFNNESAFVFTCGESGNPNWREIERRTNLPDTTWALIDSNQDLVSVPISYHARFFIVQASSPRPDRFAWQDKVHLNIMTYIMKPWTVSELLQGRTLQPDTSICSEEDVIKFFNLFGPSARSVYANASSVEYYDTNLHRQAQSISIDELERIFRDATAFNLSKNYVSHKLVLISAGEFRHEPSVTIPTRHVYDLLFDKRSERRLEDAARLYGLFIQNRFTRSAACYFLGDHYHSVICKGGQWQVLSMKASNPPGPKNTHWKFDYQDPTHPLAMTYLRLGFEGHPITFSTVPLPDGTTYSALRTKEFVQHSKMPLVDGCYYYPSSPSEETLDSFIYEASNRMATIFQATIGRKVCSVKQGGIEWLVGLGVENFRFIAVTAPEQTLDFPFPNKWHSRVAPSFLDKYVLVLESLS